MPALKAPPFTEAVRYWIKTVAMDRHMDGWVVGRKDSRTEAKDKKHALSMDVLGVAGEVAFALTWGIPWEPKLRHFKGMDADFTPDPLLGPTGIEVKTTDYARVLSISDMDIDKNPARFHWGVYRDSDLVYWVMGYIIPDLVRDREHTRPHFRDIPEADLIPASTIIELDYPASTWDVGEQEPQVATSSTGTATPKPSQPLPTIHGSSLPAG